MAAKTYLVEYHVDGCKEQFRVVARDIDEAETRAWEQLIEDEVVDSAEAEIAMQISPVGR